MSNQSMVSTLHSDLFSSLISDIKNYNGNDPLLPWLRGIRKMKDSLSSQLLKQNLPRFLQKCAQAFETDRRYANDLRYLRVWLQLMDFVDDPRAVLRRMEANHVGMKRSLFYQAYALYYEKVKKFEKAEEMYHLGVQKLAEPIDELQKSFEQFLHRMQRHKNKRIQRQERRITKRPLSTVNLSVNHDESKENNKHIEHASFLKQQESFESKSDEASEFHGDDTFVVKFVDTAIIGRSVAEDACHHGLVEPTINTNEALNAINSMFREPIETAFAGRRSCRSRPKADPSLNGGFEVFIDENTDNIAGASNQNARFQSHQPLEEPLQIYIDDEESNGAKVITNEKDNFEQSKIQQLPEVPFIPTSCVNAFVFPRPKDLPLECSEDPEGERSAQLGVREDTVFRRFVGSTISDDPQVENVCHHGLVEPTINLKEAMENINSMFGKPIDFVRTKRSKKQDKAPEKKNNCGGFVILPDDEIDHQPRESRPILSAKNDNDLFEPTVCTKDAMDEINKMFGMPLDF